MAKILIHNKKQSIKLTLLVVVLFFSALIVPLIFHVYFYYTNIYKFIINNNYLIYIASFLFFYVIYNGIFYYKIKFDSSSLRIESRRTLSIWFISKVYNIEITNDMLIGFRFVGSFLSINDKLLIQMRSSSGRKSAVRIPLTLVGKKRKRKLEQIFNKIIQNNECQTS